MSDLPGGAPRRHHRANWVALRTLRQVPKVVGETSAGDSVFEIRSVRLVLPPDAAHFSRIVTCSHCGGDAPGPAVLTPADLDHLPHGVICRDCVRTAATPTPATGPGHADVADRPPPDAAVGNGTGTGRTDHQRNGDARLAALEQRTVELIELLDVERGEWEAALDGRTRETRAEVAALGAGARQLAGSQEALERAVDGLVRQVGGVADVDGHRLEELEQQAEEAAQRLTGRADVDRSELGDVLEGRLGRLEAQREEEAGRGRTDVDRFSLDYEELGRGQAEMKRRLDGVTERLAQDPATSGRRLQALEERLDRLAEMVASQRLELQAGLREGLAEVHSMMSVLTSESATRLRDLEGRAGRDAVDVSELAELQAALDRGLGELRSEMAAARDANRLVADGQAEVDRRLEAVEEAQRAARDEHGRRRGGKKRRAAAVAAHVASCRWPSRISSASTRSSGPTWRRSRTA